MCCTSFKALYTGNFFSTNALSPFHSHVGIANLVSYSPTERIYFYCTTKFISKELVNVFIGSYGWVPASAIAECLHAWPISLAWPPLFTGRVARDRSELVHEMLESFPPDSGESQLLSWP